MKRGWEVKRLAEICEKASSNVSQNQLMNEKGRYPIYGAGGLIKNVSFYHQSKEYVSIVKDGAGIGRISLLPAYSSVIGTLQYLLPKENIDLRYFYYTLSGIDFLKYKNGSTIPHIYYRDYSEESLVIPPLPEQKRIVSVIDESFAVLAKAKENAEKNLANARELFESVLQSVINNKKWEKKTLKEVSNTFSRGKSKNRPRGDAKLYGGKYPFIQTGDISNANHWIINYSQTYNEVGLAQSKLWPKGTICIAIVGANVGETAILGFDACFPDSVIGIVVDNKTTSNEYIEYLLQTFKPTLKVMGKGTARDNINVGMFENQKFPFPSLTEQRAIVKKLNTLSAETKKLKGIYQQKFSALEELKKSLLQKAFAGEL